MGLGSVIKSVTKSVGGVLGAVAPALSFIGGERRNSAQTAASNKQMRFQKEMSNTAYQRAMEDMRAAGLNPILAGKLGGASTPGGAQPILHDTLTPAVNSAMSAMQTGALVDQTESNIALQQVTMNKLDAEVSHIGRLQALTDEQIAEVQERVKLIGQDYKLRVEQIGVTNADKWFKKQLIDVIENISGSVDSSWIASAMRLLLILKGER